jgi:hypothetical protein
MEGHIRRSLTLRRPPEGSPQEPVVCGQVLRRSQTPWEILRAVEILGCETLRGLSTDRPQVIDSPQTTRS